MAEEMDPCECLWNHELAMRRLISMLRQGQSYCTDTECLDDITRPSVCDYVVENGLMMTFLMMAFAFVMYMLRPRRNQIEDVAKPARNTQDRDGAPPAPPAQPKL